jgi:hypothetical protein
MSHPSYRLGYPVAKMRLYWSVITTAFFLFLLYSASVRFGWFTLIRGFYLSLGIVEGLLIGWFEAKVVTGELMKKAETIAWQMLPISIVLGGLPLLLAITLFGVSEFLPFAAYFVFPFVPAYLATSGWRYNEFEKERKAQILMFVYGLKYWIEPIIDVSDRFAQFIYSVVSKDPHGIFNQAGYSKRFMALIDERPKIEPSTKNFLSKILETMKRYRRRSLTIASIFVISMLILIIYFFVLVSTNAFGLVKVVDERIVSGQAIDLILGCVPTFSVFGGVVAARLLLNRRYQKKISTLLASLNLNISSDLKNLSES